jgi:signal transduction histidine kinase
MNMVQLGLLIVICTPFALAILLASRRRMANHVIELAQPDELMPVRFNFEAVILEVEPALRAVAEAAHPLARTLFVHVELAMRPGTRLRVDPIVFRAVLQAAIGVAIRATPGGQVLISGSTLGGQLHIRIVDDGTNTDQQYREGLIREASTLIALQGGSTIVEARSGLGTTVTLRLPLPRDVNAEPDEFDEVPDLADQAV